jgi:predicted phosphodiesterase
MTKILPTEMLAYPSVFAMKDTYQIFIPFSCEVLVSVRVNEIEYYDDSNGIMRSNTNMHKVEVPMAELDAAGEYTLIYRKMIERKPYFPTSEEPVELSFNFKSVANKETINIYHISDAHNIEAPVIAAGSYFGDELDLLVLNGDIINHSGRIENFNTIYKIASGITKGSIPIVFSRGNHDTRGIHAEEFGNYTPTDNGRTYYTFRAGSIWGLILDCGEDKLDTHEEYGHTICFHRFRQKETEFIKKIIANADNEYNAHDVKHKLVICHIPFTYIHKPPFDIEQEIYSEWTKLLREEIHPELLIYGHIHTTEIWRKGSDKDAYGQPCHAIVGSKPIKSENGDHHFVGGGITLGEKKTTVIFNDDCGNVIFKEEL